MSWLQIGCPFCPSEINVPAFLVDTPITCDACGKTYLVPPSYAPVLAAAGPLPPLAILRTPGLAGNSSGGISPIPHLPAPIVGDLGVAGESPAGEQRAGELRIRDDEPDRGETPVFHEAGVGGSSEPDDGRNSSQSPAKPRRGGSAPYPWEMSPEARASAAAIFGDSTVPGEAEDDLEAVQRRMRKERIRAYTRWIMIGLGMLFMCLVAAYFLRRR